MTNKRAKTDSPQNGIYWAFERLMNCRKVAFLLGESLERALNFRERIVAKMHLLMCRDCRNYLANLRFMRAVFQKKEKFDDREETDVKLNEDARERIRRSLENLSK